MDSSHAEWINSICKTSVEVEKNDKIIYITLKFLIKKYDVDCNIASASFIRNFSLNMDSEELSNCFEIKISLYSKN